MKVIPLSDRVIISPKKQEEITASGIILPKNDKNEVPQIGEIIAVGDGRERDDGTKTQMIVAIGQQVVFSKYAGDDVEIDGENLKIIPQDSILAILK